jgi:hypothetical protein
MLRTTMLALAAASAFGISVASAAPVNGSVFTVATYENGALQQVWYRRHHHRYWYRHHRRWWW